MLAHVLATCTAANHTRRRNVIPAVHRHSFRARGLGCVLAAFAVLTAGCANASGGPDSPGVVISTPEDTSAYHGVEERRYELPDVTLTAASGGSFNLAADTGKPVTMVFFGYTNCPDICPTTTANIAQAMRQLPDSAREQVQFVFITSDPARDTPDVLRTWLDRFDDSYVGLTGKLDKIERAAEKLGVPLSGKEKLPSGGYLVGHGSQVLAFGPDGSSRVLWTAGTPVGEYRADIARLVRSV